MLQRLGFPVVGPHRRFVGAIAVDAVGSGVFLPVSILYFLHTTSLALTTIGLAVSSAAALQLPLGPFVGGLVDRIGAKRVLLLANFLQGAGFVAYIFVSSFASVLAAAAIVQLGSTAFWSSFNPVVATIAQAGERERWFGFLGALRNASFAVGGIAAAIVVTLGTTSAYTMVVLVNAASYALAFFLLLSVPSHGQEPVRAQAGGASTGWRQVLRDRPYGLLVTTNFTYALSAMVLNVVVPVYVTQSLGLPGWVAGAVFTLNTVMIGFGQGLVVNAVTGSVRANIVALGSLLYAASYLVLLSASWTTVWLGVVIALFGGVVFTGGEMVAGPVLSALATDAAPPNLRGRYVSLYQMSWTASGTVAPVAMTWLLEQGSVALWGALTFVAMSGAALSVLLRSVLPQAATTVPDTRYLTQPTPA